MVNAMPRLFVTGAGLAFLNCRHGLAILLERARNDDSQRGNFIAKSEDDYPRGEVVFRNVGVPAACQDVHGRGVPSWCLDCQ